MPVALLVLGALLILAAVNNQIGPITNQVASDWLETNKQSGGQGSATTQTVAFIAWAGLVLFVGLLGRAAHLENAAKAFIALVIVVFLLSAQGVFKQFVMVVTGQIAPGQVNPLTAGGVQKVPGSDVKPEPDYTQASPAAPNAGAGGSLGSIGKAANPVTFFSQLNKMFGITVPGLAQ